VCSLARRDERDASRRASAPTLNRIAPDSLGSTKVITPMDASEMAATETPRVEPERTPFPELAFQGALRPSQREVIEMANAKLASGLATDLSDCRLSPLRAAPAARPPPSRPRRRPGRAR
jgi:hypothetical protein